MVSSADDGIRTTRWRRSPRRAAARTPNGPYFRGGGNTGPCRTCPDVPAFLRALRESDASEPVRLGFELTIRGSVVELGPAESLFPATVGEFHRTYEPSIDGQRFLVATAAAEGGAAITVLVNWRQMLEQ